MDWKETVAGGVAGFAQALVGHPFDTIKVNMQMSSEKVGMGTIVQRIIKRDGALGVYKGVQSPLTGLFMMNAALFSSYGAARRLLGETPTTPLALRDYWYAGFLAGLVVAFVEGPVDFFKCQLQMRPEKYRGFVHCSTSIIKERGLLGAYQGIVPTVIRNAPANAAWYGVYEWARAMQLKEGQTKADLAQWRVVVSGGVGGWAYWLCIYPVDLVKSTIQSDHVNPSQRVYSGTLDAVAKINQQYGLKGFFRGLTPCLLRAFPANGAAFFTYEYAMNQLNNRS